MEYIIKIGICDANEGFVNETSRMIKDLCEELAWDIEIYKLYSWQEFSESHIKLDILFIGIDVPKLEEIEGKDAYANIASGIKMIYVTEEHELIYDCFGENVYGFLKKPIERKRLYKILLSAGMDIDKFNHIMYITAEKQYVKIFVGAAESKLLRMGIGEIQKKLDGTTLIKCHRSFIVNLKCIKCQVENFKFFQMEDERLIPISKRNRKEARKRYVNFKNKHRSDR